MNQGKMASVTAILLLVAGGAVRVEARSEAGACAAIQGTVELRRGGAWRPAEVAAAVFVGDQVRTGAQSRAKIVFRDDSVLDLAPNTEVSLKTQEFDESAQHYRSLLQLVEGKIGVRVSEYYAAPRARYEVETPTAIAAVRGTHFIAIYDGATEISAIVALDGRVEVSARLAVMGAGVSVGARFSTRIPKGKFPSTPQSVDAASVSRYLAGVDLVGTGRRDGLNVLHPAVVGRILAPQDVPGAGEAAGPAGRPGAAGTGPAPVLTLRAPLPGSAADNLSPDVYTNTQPLRGYRETPGSVRVEF